MADPRCDHDDLSGAELLQALLHPEGLARAPLAYRHRLSDGEWASLASLASSHRIIGLLGQADGTSLDLSEGQRKALKGLLVQAMAWCLRVEEAFGRVAQRLDAQDVDYRVLKGVATSRLLYSKPGLREFGDLDIVVRPTDFERALAALRPLAIGAIPRYGTATAQVDKGETLIDKSGVEIDIHHTVKGWSYSSRVSGDLLFAEPQPVSIGRRSALALSEPAMLVQAALHMTTAGWRLSTAADLSLLAQRVRPVDPGFTSLVTNGGVADAVWLGLGRAAEWVPLPQEWLDYLADQGPWPPWARVLTWFHTSPRRQQAVAFASAPRRARRSAELLWPSREWLDYTGVSRAQHLRGLARGGERSDRPEE